MASLHFTTTPSFTLTTSYKTQPHLPPLKLNQNYRARPVSLLCRRPVPGLVRTHKVTIEHDGQTTELEVEPDETILSKALDIGMSVPHDCKLGVCMTCPEM